MAWCWVPCFAFPSVRLAGAPEVRRAALGAEPGCASGRQPGVLCVLSGSFFMHFGGLLSLAPSSFWHRHWAAVKGEHSTLARPHQNAGVPDACPALGTAPHVWGKPLRACRIKPRKKNSVPQKTRAAPFLARFEGVVSGHARVRSHYDAPACAARNAASRASASARSRRSSVTAAAAFEASSSARAARSAYLRATAAAEASAGLLLELWSKIMLELIGFGPSKG